MKQILVGRPKSLPTEITEFDRVIKENEYCNIKQVAEYYGVNTSTIHRSELHDEILHLLQENRKMFVARVDKKLFDLIMSGKCTAADFKLFYKRYGDKEVRDSLKDTTVIETGENITSLCDLE